MPAGCEAQPLQHHSMRQVKHIIAAGIDDRHGKGRLAFKASGKNIVDVTLKEQGHLPGKRRCARDGNEMLAFLRSCFSGRSKPATNACPRLSTSIRHTPMRLTPLASCASASMLLLKA